MQSPFNTGKKDSNESSMTYKATGLTVQNIVPEPVRLILVNQFASVGLKFDPTKIDLSKDMRGELKRVRETVEMISNNSKLLPMFAAELKKAMAAAQKYGKFQAEMVREGLKAQAGIDSDHADILLSFAGYVKQVNSTGAKLENKLKKLNKLTEAQSRFYSETWGAQAQMIDARYDIIRDTKLKTIESAAKRQDAQVQRADKNRQWLEQAY